METPPNLNANIKEEFVPDSTMCPEDGIIISNYLWEKELQIKLECLGELKIDIWCNTVHQFYKFTSAPELVISNVKGFGLREHILNTEDPTPPPEDTSDDKTAALLSHAQSLLDRAKVFVTKPPSKSKSGKRKLTDVKKQSGSAIDLLHSQTLDNLALLHVGTDGNSQQAEAPEPKKRQIKCKMCSKIFETLRELNAHHRADHGIVKCPKCDKYFSSQTSLDKHSYSHGDLRFNCEECGRQFLFESRLEQHKMTHINIKLSCPKKNCDHEFKSIGDINRHIKTHSKGGWFKCDKCSYKNKNKQNTESHMHTYLSEEDGKYVCDKCGKKMRYSTQFLRHKEQGCQI